MAKDTLALLKRFIEDEDAALREGRVGTLWGKEKGRIGPLVQRAWMKLSWTECASFYAHLMRRTRKIPTVTDYSNLMGAYRNLSPDWDRIGFVFRFGYDGEGPLPSGMSEDTKQFNARHKVVEGFTGYPSLEALRGRAGRFTKSSKEFAPAALDAIRRCGYSESSDPDEVPGSQTYWGLVLLAMLHPTVSLDYLDEARALPRLRADAAHDAELRATVEAAHGAAPSADLARRLTDWAAEPLDPTKP